jgi:hypothetical protein
MPNISYILIKKYTINQNSVYLIGLFFNIKKSIKDTFFFHTKNTIQKFN